MKIEANELNTFQEVLDIRRLRNSTYIDNNRNFVSLVPLSLSAVDYYHDVFDVKRPHELLRRMHPSTLFTTDSNVRVQANQFIDWVSKHQKMCYWLAIHSTLGRIGHFSAQGIDATKAECRVSYAVFDPAMWNKGLGKNICRAGLSLLQDNGMKKIVAEAAPDNIASVKIIKNLFDRKLGSGDKYSRYLQFK